MPGVKSELQLQDRMSSVIRDILQGLDSCIDAMEQIERTGSTAFDPKTLNNMRTAANSASEQLNEMSDSERKAGDSAESSEKKHDKLKKTLKAVGVAAAAGTAVVGAAVVKIGKEALDAYANYEQLVGGVETLFKDAAPQVQQYASEAFKTAGLSANEYMETVTGFSASLLQSVGGDTAKAAKYADMAVRDMSDNANKMGSDMSSIQNAYQGFAKQNYTMLDNLKLGYGGTKQEMERLLADAEKLSGVKYDISSYSDIVDAIHVVQTEMGITGTTALEAEKTISGSLNMLKGSWQNLLTGLGDPAADVGKLANDVISSLTTVINNVLPVLSTVFEALPGVLDNLLTGLLGSLGQVGPVATKAVLNIAKTVISKLPEIAKVGTAIVVELINQIGSMLPELIPLSVEAIVTLVGGLIESLPMVLDAGLQLLMGLGEGLIAALPALIDSLPVIIDGLATFFESATPALMEAGFELLTALLDNLPGIISNIVSKLPQIISRVLSYWTSQIGNMATTGFQLFIALIQRIGEVVSQILGKVRELCSNILSTIRDKISDMVNVGYNLLVGLWNGIKKAKDWVIGKIQGIGSSILGALRGIFQEHSPSKATDLMGVNLMKGLGGGITRSAGEALSAARAVSSDVLNSFGDMSATAKIGAEYTGLTGSAFAYDGGGYSNYRDAAAAHGSSAPVININVDLSGMQNSIASGNDVEDLVTVLVDGLQRKAATAMQGVV